MTVTTESAKCACCNVDFDVDADDPNTLCAKCELQHGRGNIAEFYGHWYPCKNIVCPRCDGEGHHTNPSIDGNGITASEWAEFCDEDEDFADNYMSGVYDVQCYRCHGAKVIKAPDESRMNAEQRKRLNEDVEEEEDYRAERRAEMRAEMGFDFREDDLGYHY